MTHGLRVENPSGTLVLSADTPSWQYHGKATLVTTTPYTASGGDRLRGFHTYEFTLPHPDDIPLVAVSPAPGYTAGNWVAYRKLPTASTWRFDCMGTLPTLNGQAIQTGMAPAEVFVFRPTRASLGSSHGMLMYDQSGRITFDSAARNLWVRQRVDFPARNSSFIDGDSTPLFGGCIKPALLTCPLGSTLVGHPSVTDEYIWAWEVTDGGTVLRRRRVFQERDGEGGSDPFYSLPAHTTFIIEANGLT